MTIWLDAQLPPALAEWIKSEFLLDAISARDLKMQTAKDHEIFMAARAAQAVVMTKDVDFVRLNDELGVPPQIIWLTCGNTSNGRLQEILKKTLGRTVELIRAGEPVVEIRGK